MSYGRIIDVPALKPGRKVHLCAHDTSPLTGGVALFAIGEPLAVWATCRCGARSPVGSSDDAVDLWASAHPCYVEWFARTGGNSIQHGAGCSDVEV